MRHAFSLKALIASRASIGENINTSPTAEGIEVAENTVAGAAFSAAQVPTLRIAQRHLSGIPFWFEQQEQAERGGKRDGSDSWSSTIRAVYAEAWGGDDERVDGLDLLLTLCAVPGSAVPGGGVLGGGAVDDESDGGSGKRQYPWVGGLNIFELLPHADGTACFFAHANNLVLSLSRKRPHLPTTHGTPLSRLLCRRFSHRDPVFSRAFPSLCHAGRTPTSKRDLCYEQRRIVIR